MRVLFTIYPNSLAHLYPVVPLAWALQSAGHEVRVAAHHSAAEQIITTGLSPVALGDPDTPEVRLTDGAKPPKTPEEVDAYARVLGLTEREREHWITYFQYLFVPMSDYLRVDRSEASDLVEFCRTWQPDLVLWDVTVPSAAVAARVSGAAQARLVNGEDVFAFSLDKLAEHAGDLRAAGLDENPLATMMRPLADKYGVEIDRELLLGQFSVDTIPDGLQLPTRVNRVHVRHIPFAGAQTFPKWLHEKPERPRVALTLGESTRRFIRGDWDRTPKIMKALEGLDIEVVATLNSLQLDDVEKIPDNVRVIEWVNLTHLMPTCSAMIHHGGIGTYSAAVPAKVPHLVCDIEGESLMLQPVQDTDASRTGTLLPGLEHGKREERDADAGPPPVFELPAKKVEATPVSEFVIAQGSGARLDHRAQTVEEMRALILEVATSEAYRKGAEDVHAQWLATPSPSDVVPVLERLAAEHRRHA
ncbi:nucleotide disphospho-sugar-binding domain-containing protein [Actinomadura harenae]|uniref:DUF1205 domain-containing protein n=1 Tax=Actinomadura harenae TaxID=2483351 RepID=A0A3M2LU39_9ACTN|nr:nucleotide disphospho-sugar-binding domain-containing protein [Actinomadura harenae]RMI40752.1 DUF1205 domain-containing protein [Actinomadura harenae]